MNYKERALSILANVGGKENVITFTHCATRIRFNLKNSEAFNESKLVSDAKAIGTVIAGGQHQVIIGTDVSHVYDELTLLMDVEQQSKVLNDFEVSDLKKKFSFSSALDTISGIFTPILPAITGAAMIKVLVILLTMTGILVQGSQTHVFLTFVGDTPFYFLPIMLSYSAALKFKMNPMMGMLLALMLIHPTYINLVDLGESVKLFGILPVTLAKYSSTVIPIILIVWVGSYVEHFTDKISPKSIRFFMKPLLTILIMIPIAFVVVGPLGTILGFGLESILNTIQTQAPWLLPIIFGVISPIVIMFGMHYVVTIPLVMTAIAVNGFDMLGAGFLVANIAQGGAALAISLLSRNVETKALASSTGITALLGITEPAIYGINLKYKKPFLFALIGGGLGGLVCGLAGVKRIVFGPTGLTTIPIFIDPTNSMNIIFAIIGVLVAFILSFTLTYFLCKRDEKIMNEIGVV